MWFLNPHLILSEPHIVTGINYSCTKHVEFRNNMLREKKKETTLHTVVCMTFWKREKWKDRNQLTGRQRLGARAGNGYNRA